jgi:ribonuclease BN (tRNA processing enzyme)
MGLSERSAVGPTGPVAKPPSAEPLSLTVLGCGGTYAGPGNACSGYLLRTGPTTVLVDLGSGTLANAQRHIELKEIDAIVLSHEHPDHWLDLPVARNVYRYVLERRGLPVYATAGTKDAAHNLCFDGAEAATFDWTVISDGGEVEIGDLRLSFTRTDHPVETMAVRAEANGGSLVYSADTGADWSPTSFGNRPDLALIEATFVEAPAPHVHLTAHEAGEKGAEADAGRLVITHLLPGTDPERQRAAAQEAYGGPVDLAEPGATFTVGAG